MPLTARLSRLVMYGLPLAFVVFAWLTSSTLPQLLEREESFVSTLQTRSSELVTPRALVSMTPRQVEWQRPENGTSYAQLPSAPRLLHYLLMGAGLRDGPAQILVISLLGTAITVVLLWRLFGQPGLLAVPLAVVLDYTGFLAWTLNASRIWTFVLFFGLVFTVRKNQPIWFGVLAFCLIQVDYRIATFVGVTVLAYALLAHRLNGLHFVVAGLIGAALPLVIFSVEVMAFHGWDDFVHEVSVGRSWLLSFGSGSDGLRYFYQAGHGPLLMLGVIAQDSHNVAVFVTVIAGIICSLFAMSRASIWDAHGFVAHLTVSAAFGTIVLWCTLYNQVVEGLVDATLPLTSFLIAPALGSLALELSVLVGMIWKGRHLVTLTTVIVLLPLVAATTVHLRPSVESDLMRALPASVRERLGNVPVTQSWLRLPVEVGALAAPDELTVLGASRPTTRRRKAVAATPDDRTCHHLNTETTWRSPFAQPPCATSRRV